VPAVHHPPLLALKQSVLRSARSDMNPVDLAAVDEAVERLRA
jgi:hypothetical protein